MQLLENLFKVGQNLKKKKKKMLKPFVISGHH